jgi:hypothetical protein
MRKLIAGEKRLLVLFAILAAITAWFHIPRPRSPTVALETEHYAIRSSATEEQTREIGQAAEIVYSGYQRSMSDLQQTIGPHPKPGIKLFKDRREFRHCNRIYGWAEAFYRPPFFYQHYSVDEIHPYHGMMREATHQRNAEVARLCLPQDTCEG